MTIYSDDMTVAEARDLLEVEALEGTTCPCCRQRARIYTRLINSSLALSFLALARLTRDTGREWFHVSEIIEETGLPHSASREFSIVRYWGIVETKHKLKGERGRASGYWRLTKLGEEFALGQVMLPKYARIFDAELLALEGEPVTIHAFLKDGVDYEELMSKIAGHARRTKSKA